MATTIDSDLKVSGLVAVQADTLTNPPEISAAASGVTVGNKANGSLHLRTDTDETPQVIHNGAAEQLGLRGHCIECRMDDLVANQANMYTTYLPRGAIITGISRRFTTHPSSAAGTVVTGITLDGNQILQSASEDEESVSDDTLTAYTLTGTSAYLEATVGKKIVVTITSNNADMAGGTSPMVYIYYHDN